MSEWQKVKIREFLGKKSILAEDIDNAEELQHLGVSNKLGITVTDHRKSKDISKHQYIEHNYFAYNPYRINVGSIGLTPENVIGLVSPAYVVFKTKENLLLPELLLDFLKSSDGLFQINKLARGTVRKALRFSELCDIEMVMPPIEIQRKILKIKQSLQKEIAGLSTEINKQQTYLTKLRQAILQEAIEGKLTVGWRVKNPVEKGNPNTDAGALLATIKAEKQKLIADGKIKTTKKQESIVEDDLISSIPESWNYEHLDDISLQITDGTHQTPTYTKEGRIFLSAQNIKPFKFMPDNHKFVSESAYQAYVKNAKAEKGDLLIGRVGAGIGETAVVDREMDFAIYVSLGLIKPFKQLNSNFLCLIFNSPYGVRYAKGNISSGGGSAGNFNLGRIRSFSIPLPPLAEQNAIVERVDRLLASVNVLEHQVQERKTYAEQLMQAVLKEAFAG